MFYVTYFFHQHSFGFAQIGQVSGPSHQNGPVARGCISGKNISAQPCVKVKLFLLSAQHMPECCAAVYWLCLYAYINLISIRVLQNLCMYHFACNL